MPRVPKLDPQRGRRGGRGAVLLPAAGREGPPPPWPLPGEQSVDEREAWAQLWTAPQAVAWERIGCVRLVARYCRMMVAAEAPDATAALLAQVTALEDRLGLTPKAMRLMLWQVAEAEVVNLPVPSSARTRMRAVDARRGGAA